MATVSFSENQDFQEQMAEYLAEIREKLSPDDRAKIDEAKSKIDTCTDIIDKQATPDPDIRPGILNSEFRIIDDIVDQNIKKDAQGSISLLRVYMSKVSV